MSTPSNTPSGPLWDIVRSAGISISANNTGAWTYHTTVGLKGGPFATPEEALKAALTRIVNLAKRAHSR
jgi:hypothetical protein